MADCQTFPRTATFDPAVAAGLNDRVIITHGAQVDADTLQRWADAGLDSVHVGRGGDTDVDLLMAALAERGHTLVFSAAGPNILAMLAGRSNYRRPRITAHMLA